MSTLANDIARCPGVGNDSDVWREGCEDCLRRTAPRPDPAWWMTTPAVIVFECESRTPEITGATRLYRGASLRTTGCTPVDE